MKHSHFFRLFLSPSRFFVFLFRSNLDWRDFVSNWTEHVFLLFVISILSVHSKLLEKNNFLLFSLVFLPFFLFLLSNNKLFVFNDKRFGLGLSTKLRVPTLYFTRATNNIKLQSNWHRLCQWEAGTVAWPLPGLTLLNLLLIVIAS